MSLTAEQLAQRRTGVSATDISKILGLNPYASAIDVWLDKMGQAPPYEEHPRAKWGLLLEDPIRQDFGERHGVYVRPPEKIGTLVHPENPRHMATPDGLILPTRRHRTPEAVWEAKTHTTFLAGLYGEAGSDDLPAWELTQVAWNLYVCGHSQIGEPFEKGHLTAFIDNLPTDFQVRRDAELEGMLVEAADRFWVDYVEAGRPPEPDGSDGWDAYIAKLLPRHEFDEYLAPTTEQMELIHRLRHIRDMKKDLTAKEDVVVQQLKLAIGAAPGFEWEDAEFGKRLRIHWKRSKDSIKISWDAVAQEYRSMIELAANESAPLNDRLNVLGTQATQLDAIIKRHTETKDGPRPFKVPAKAWSRK